MSSSEVVRVSSRSVKLPSALSAAAAEVENVSAPWANSSALSPKSLRIVFDMSAKDAAESLSDSASRSCSVLW